MDQNTSVTPYTFCPIGGIVCSICKYPVSTVKDYGYFQGIYYHEKQNKNHAGKLNTVDRKQLLKDFEGFIDELASEVVSKLHNQYLALQVVTAKLDVRRNYHFCSHDGCQKLVISKLQHKSGNHTKYCKQIREGFGSKMWTKHEPKLLDAEFILYDNNGEISPVLCEPLRQLIKKKYSIIMSAVSESTFVQLLDERMSQINRTDSNIEVRVQTEHETNSWIRRVGWDFHLKGLNVLLLVELKAPVKDEEVTLQRFLKSFEELAYSSYEILKTTTNPSAMVRWTMNRNTKKEGGGTKPFTMVHNETMKKYMLVMHDFISVLYRLAILKREQRCTIPNFGWFGSQEAIIFQYFEHLEMNEQTPISKCLDVLVAMFNQTIRADPYQHIVLSVLSIIAIKSDGTFESHVKTKQQFAAIFKMMKIIVYRQAYEDDVNINGTDPITSNILEILANKMDFMTYESSSPISWMYQVFNYATELSNNDFSLPKISWIDDDTIYCDNISINISHMKQILLPSVVSELTTMMQKLLLLPDGCSIDMSPPVPAIMHDSPSTDTKDYNFLKHNGNHHWMKNGDRYVLDNMLRHFHHIWLDNASTGRIETINKKTFEVYERTRTDFLKLLLFVIHITSGQPGRGTEVVDIRYANTASIRNLFYDNENKMLFIWSRYHKGYNQSNQAKHICRFIPTIISHLIIRYLWLVLPFSQSMEVMYYDTKVVSAYLFARKTTITRDAKYDEGVFQSIDLTHTLCETFMRFADARVTISTWRHIAIAIADKYFKIDKNFVDLNDEWDYQCAHSPAVANSTYGNVTSLPDIATSKFHSYRHISELWHKLWGMSNDKMVRIEREDHDKVTTLSTFQAVARQQCYERRDRLSTSFNAQSCLMRFFGVSSSVEFRGYQKQVLNAITIQVPNILHIAATGEGKSLSFLLLGFHADGGITIVIAPLVSLKYDFLKRCRLCKVNAKEWTAMSNSGDYCHGLSIIFVTPESSVSVGFKSLVKQLKQLYLLDRIVFDECHMYLNCNEDFRETMGNIGSYYNDKFGIQRIYMTATLPPMQHAEFFELMKIDPMSIRIFRSRTRRKNISYYVKRLNTSDGCIQSIRQEIKKLGDCNEKVIIFCRTVNDVEAISSALKCYKYYHNLQNKEEQFRQWNDNNRVQVIATTSGLGAGIDIPNISLAILLGAPKTLSELVQAAGRTGRSGKPSQALVLDIHRNKYYKPDQEVVDFLESNRCRRCAIDQCMDGTYDAIHTCNYDDNGESLCDICQQNQPEPTNVGRVELCDTIVIPTRPILAPPTLYPQSTTPRTIASAARSMQRATTPYSLGGVCQAIPTPSPIINSTAVTESEILNFDVDDLFSYNIEEPQLPIPPKITAHPETSQKLTLNIEEQLADLRECRRYVDTFANRCTICVLTNTAVKSRETFTCKQHSQMKNRLLNEMKARRDTISNRRLMPLYHGCSHSGCYVPQLWCARWKTLSTQGEEIRYQLVENVACNYRNILIEVIVGCSMLNERCRLLCDGLKDRDMEYQTGKVVWGNVRTIRLLKTFYLVYKEFLSENNSKKRKN